MSVLIISVIVLLIAAVVWFGYKQNKKRIDRIDEMDRDSNKRDAGSTR